MHIYAHLRKAHAKFMKLASVIFHLEYIRGRFLIFEVHGEELQNKRFFRTL